MTDMIEYGMYSSLLIISSTSHHRPSSDLGLGMVSDGDGELELVIAEWDNYLDRET